MYIKQSKNTFIRCADDGKGYITNQMTCYDRIYDDIGADFLRVLSREPQDVEDIVREKLMSLYEGVSAEELKKDFIDFALDLARNLFVVIGDSPEELERKETEFSYAKGNMKTQVYDYTQHTDYDVKENSQDVKLEADQRKPHLTSLQFELTSRCNERCIHCYIPNAKKDAGGDMKIEQVKDIIDQFAEMGGQHITLSGGEVFLHKDVIRIMQYCREKDMRISILSNLISLRDVQIPFIKAANVSLIQTSLYSVDPAVHDKITKVKGSCEKTKAAIDKLIAADIPVQISCPIMKANKDSYRAVLKYAQERNIKADADYIMMAQSDLDPSNLANRLSVEETEVVLRDIIQYDLDYFDMMKETPSKTDEFKFDKERFKKQPLCGAGMNECCITENGDVYPCAGWQAYVLGNINEKSLKDIWENSEKAKFIRGITHGDFEKCLECEAFDFCAMCLVRNFNESNGDMFKINQHFCDVAFLNKRLVEEYQAKLEHESQSQA